MKKEYNHLQIEPKWQSVWEQEKIFTALDNDKNREKYFILFEFPYPSGEGLHVGHCRADSAMDAIARIKRMQGKNVIFPTGWDAFGLPAENYAIKTGTHPAQKTAENIKNYRRQVKSLGLSIDWDREIDTTDPKYFRWTQWIFLQLYKNGLAYRQKSLINWCPSCMVGLANEEVVDGKCDRCGAVTTKKEMEQWMLRITAYADRLIDDLHDADYPEKVKAMQINWIGRSEGSSVKFQVTSADSADKSHPISVFTTRPDTLFGATFLALAPEHESIQKIVSQEQKVQVQEYIQKALNKSNIERKENKDKTGVFTGAYAINPINNQEIPIWVADYVLSDYGTGAIMAVPAHDQRDFEFARKFDLPITQVIDSREKELDLSKEAFTDIANGFLINSGEFDNLSCTEAIEKITAKLAQNKMGEKTINYQLNDWVFSRQRYWGEPIPIVYCEKCGEVPLPEDQLPLELPEVPNYSPTATGESPLANIADWVNTTCPQCGGAAKRETNTMPQWAGSSWYWLRFTDPHNDTEFASKKNLQYWTPVDLYNGGMEHTTLHLLYSRFWHKFLFDQGLVPTNEPFKKRISHGYILGEGGIKMSKSRGNVINPDDIIKQYGADTLRAYEMFIAPYPDTAIWDTNGIKGVNRWLYKVWNLAQDIIIANDVILETPEQWLYDAGEIAETQLAVRVNKAIKKISGEYEKMSFNTVISHLMIFTNDLIAFQKELPIAKDPIAWRQTLEALLLLLSPACPHIAEELWQQMGHSKSICLMNWPQYDEKLFQNDLITIPVQINGVRRGEMTVATDLSQEEILSLAKQVPNIIKYLQGKKIVKEIYINGKIINFVIK